VAGSGEVGGEGKGTAGEGTSRKPGETIPGKGKVSEPRQNYTLEKPTKAIDFKLELPFGKKIDTVSNTVSAARRRVAIPATGSELHSGNVGQSAGDALALAKGIRGFSMQSTPQEKLKPSPKKKDDSSLDNLLLTPSERESLRKDGKEASLRARGKFKHLFKHEKKRNKQCPA